MKAIVYEKYGPPEVLQLREIEKPVPKENEVLVKIKAASVNPLDWHFMRADPFLMRFVSGLNRPKEKILGADIAGQVEAAGKNVKQFQAGDEVYGEVTHGGFAEYVCVSEERLEKKPANLYFEEAAAVPVAAITALQCLRDQAQIKSGQKILINGASCGVGTFAVQLAAYYGAEVTGVCSTPNSDMVRAIGADKVIDYTQNDFTKSDKIYDIILDNIGNRSLAEVKRILAGNGIFLLNGYSPLLMIKIALRPKALNSKGQIIRSADVAQVNQKDLQFLTKLLEAGNIKPVIDRSYSLNEVPQAVGYLEKGHAQGKVVITIS